MNGIISTFRFIIVSITSIRDLVAVVSLYEKLILCNDLSLLSYSFLKLIGRSCFTISFV